MLTYDLERRGQLARYDYLYRCIKVDIFSGTLAAGEKLPSKRALARHLQVSVATVESGFVRHSSAALARELILLHAERSVRIDGARFRPREDAYQMEEQK